MLQDEHNSHLEELSWQIQTERAAREETEGVTAQLVTCLAIAEGLLETANKARPTEPPQQKAPGSTPGPQKLTPAQAPAPLAPGLSSWAQDAK